MNYRYPFPRRDEVESNVLDAKEHAQRAHLAAERARYAGLYRTRRHMLDSLSEARTAAVKALAHLDAAQSLILEQCSCGETAEPQSCEVHRISR